MPLGQIFLAIFLALESLHLGLSMELTIVIWLGAGLSALGALKLVQIERPTWGLSFVLLALGGFLGSQVLEDWALENSWAQTNGLGAGLTLSLLAYQLWLFASGEKTVTHLALNRNSQTIVVLGLLLVLLISPPEQTIVSKLAFTIGNAFNVILTVSVSVHPPAKVPVTTYMVSIVGIGV